MNTIILIFILCGLIYFTIYRKIYGLMFYFAIRMVIPSVARVGNFSFNTLMLLVLLIILAKYLYNCYKTYNQNERKYINSFIGLCSILILLTTLSPLLSIPYQLGNLLQMFGTEIVPSIILIYVLQRENDVKTFCNIVAIGAVFCSLYGIYTYFSHTNPLFVFFNTSTQNVKELDLYSTGRFGLDGIAVGIYDDKIALSLISFLLCIFLVDKRCIKNMLRYAIICLLSITAFLTTQRSAILSLFIYLCIILYGREQKRNRKKIIFASIIFICIIFVYDIEMITDFMTSILFLFDDKIQANMDISGSSSSMRFEQLTNVFLYHNPLTLLVGEGYGFTHYYYTIIHDASIYGLDDRFYGFESFLLGVFMNSGIIGIIAWGYTFVRIFRILEVKKTKAFLGIFVSYIFAILITDASASFYLFFFLIVINYKYYKIQIPKTY